jgi:hypothetical protein
MPPPKPEPFVIVGPDFSLTIAQPWISLDELREELRLLGEEWAMPVEQEACLMAQRNLEHGIYLLTQVTKVMMLSMDLPKSLRQAIAECRHGADLAYARWYGDAREDQKSPDD